MSESTRPGTTTDTPFPVEELTPGQTGAAGLHPEAIARILLDFERWLSEVATARPSGEPVDSPAESIDLHTLLGQFLALKQEINLQTRAVRGQQEQNAEVLEKLTVTVDLLASKPSLPGMPAPAGDEILRPVLKTLLDVHDALTLAAREVSRVQESVPPVLAQLKDGNQESVLQEPHRSTALGKVSFWSRWFGIGKTSHQPTVTGKGSGEADRMLHSWHLKDAAERGLQMLSSLQTGYTMSLQRLERALKQQGLEAITTQGLPFDPEQMEVLEAIGGTGRPPGEVVEEVRRGYFWKGRIFRFAQVRVARL